MAWNRARRTLVIASFALGIVAGSINAHAYTTQGAKWGNQAGQAVSYRIHPDAAPGVDDGSDLAAIRRAYASWQGVACSYLTFHEDPWEEPKSVQADGKNRIFWVTNEWPADQRATIALTFTFYSTTDRTITDADIACNALAYQWTTTDAQISATRVDVETILFHEIGHFVGLDHSQDTRAAMFGSNNKAIQRTPTTDDVLGICSLYSNGKPPPETPPGQSPVGAPCRAPEDCASRLCVEDTLLSRTYCTATCIVGQPGGCPAGYQCNATSRGELCVAPPPVDELCDQCAGSAQCASGLCLNVPGYNNFLPFCTRACDPTSGLPGQCPSGYKCAWVENAGQTGGACAPSTGLCDPPGKGRHLEPCYANGTCKQDHVCVDFFGSNSPYRYCYRACSPQDAGKLCSSSGNIMCFNIIARPGIAACINVARVQEPCMPEQCETNALCLYDEKTGVDSATCYQTCPDTRCPANMQCINYQGIGAVCVPSAGFVSLGSPCQSDAECESRVCRTFGDARLCTKPCATTDLSTCPDSFRCEADTNTTAGLCWPKTMQTRNDRRNVNLGQIPPDFCLCDTTSACDPDCACDPECGGACGCKNTNRTHTFSRQASVVAVLWVVGLVFVWRRRANRFRGHS